jgi:uncharacterized membrane protein YkoI
MTRQEILALGVGVVLILGVVVVANSTDAVSIAGSPYEESSSEQPGGQGTVSSEENSTANVTVSAVRAMGTAQNETRGTAVGIQLKQAGNATDLERPMQAYEVDVLLTNRTHLVVNIDASNGTVRNVETERNETETLGSLFENETAVPDERANPTAIRSGIEAVQFAWNETDLNRTVTEVRFTLRNETLVYDVDLLTAKGARTTAVVAAYPSEGGVLAIKTVTKTPKWRPNKSKP